MAKRKSFDPDALSKLEQVGKEIANKHKDREQEFLAKAEPKKEGTPKNDIVEKTVEKIEPPKATAKKRTTKRRTSKATKKVENIDEGKTSLCRIGVDYHKRLKMEAVKQDTTIRNLLESLIQENIPAI